MGPSEAVAEHGGLWLNLGCVRHPRKHTVAEDETFRSLQSVFLEHLPYARPCAKSWGHRGEPGAAPALQGPAGGAEAPRRVLAASPGKKIISRCG